MGSHCSKPAPHHEHVHASKVEKLFMNWSDFLMNCGKLGATTSDPANKCGDVNKSKKGSRPAITRSIVCSSTRDAQKRKTQSRYLVKINIKVHV